MKVLAKEGEYTVLECGLCDGTRADPIVGVGKCPACGGKGTVRVREPYVRCAYCGGEGIQRDRRGFSRRLTCQVCAGKGVVHVVGKGAVCPACRGTGRTVGDEFGFPWVVCSGKGVVRS